MGKSERNWGECTRERGEKNKKIEKGKGKIKGRSKRKKGRRKEKHVGSKNNADFKFF